MATICTHDQVDAAEVRLDAPGRRQVCLSVRCENDMSTLDDVRAAVSVLNSKYPRPGIPELVVSDPYDIRSSFASSYPNFNLPGVYILLSETGVVLRIGKASCGDRRVLAW